MERVDADLDASFWINAERSGLTPHLLEYFRLYAPPMVAQELTVLFGSVPDPPSAALLFADWRRRGDVQVVPTHGTFERFDAGEDEAIALAQERGWALLIDDAAARHYSRGPLGLRVVASPEFAVFLYDQGRLSHATTIDALDRARADRRATNEARITLERLRRKKGAD